MQRITKTGLLLGAMVASLALASSASARPFVAEQSASVGLEMGGYFYLNDETGFKDTFSYRLTGAYNFTRHFGAELAFDISPREVNQASIYQIHLDFIVHPIVHEWFVPFVGVGPSVVIIDEEAAPESDTDPGLNVLAGIDLYPWDNVGFRTSARYVARFGGGEESTGHDLLASFGLVVTFGGEGETEPVLLDTDGDGLLDNVDACPTVPGVETAQGCPDKDGDTITDNDDDCPDVAGPVDLGGCPDQDGDRIVDKSDRCPKTPGDKKFEGCPDTDKDDLADVDDRCPKIPGDKDYGGCPPPPPADVVEKFSGTIQGITFELASDVIRPESFPVLDEAVEVLKKYSHLRVLIEGHTSSEGTRELNLDLSRRRAASVKKYLVDKGIGDSRLDTAGYGPDRPVASNEDEAGRQQNRRIEFKILRQ